MNVSLATERLELRPLERSDRDDLLSIFSHPEVTRYYEIETMKDPAQALSLLDHFIANGRLGICLE
ncbi:MAG TPA: GNAT family N-acetyltransferase, partial [Burkholderiales bacterium]|nr:GNAT family N-acetyltransferase [Burkholderiales bacterium]